MSLALGQGAAAQSLTASGGLGVGVIDDSPATVLEAGIDVGGADAALGLGGRVSLLADGGLRTEDWDDPGEWATLIRYLTYRKPAFADELQVSLAAGELSGVELGYGGLISSYDSGIDIDHRHLGMQTRVFGRQLGASAMIDDLVAPRIAGARGYYLVFDRVYVGGAVASDLAAPVEDGEQALLGGSIDLALPIRSARRSWWVEGYTELVGWAGLGAGAHLGARASSDIGAWSVSGRTEVRGGSKSYLPGYIGALYERNRVAFTPMESQLSRVRDVDLSGIGAEAAFGLQRSGVGSFHASAAHRAGLGMRAAASFSVAELEAVQLGFHGVYEQLGADGSAWVASSELRWRLPARLYATTQAARLYRRQGQEIAPAWWMLSLIHISEPTRRRDSSRMPAEA